MRFSFQRENAKEARTEPEPEPEPRRKPPAPSPPTDGLRTCRRCGVRGSDDEFSTHLYRGERRPSNRCIPCNRAYSRRQSARSRAKVKERIRAQKELPSDE